MFIVFTRTPRPTDGIRTRADENRQIYVNVHENIFRPFGNREFNIKH